MSEDDAMIDLILTSDINRDHVSVTALSLDFFSLLLLLFARALIVYLGVRFECGLAQ